MNNLDFFNRILAKASCDRFELRKSKNNIYYLYDFEDRELIRNKIEMKDIINCQCLYEFIDNKDKQKINNIMKEI